LEELQRSAAERYSTGVEMLRQCICLGILAAPEKQRGDTAFSYRMAGKERDIIW
jgi:hypothetical protein